MKMIEISGTDLDIPRIAEYERSDTGGGFVYVIRFSDGTVKPGQSTSVASRLRTHAADGKRFGIHITDWWVSYRHDAFKESEVDLLAWASCISVPRTAEYFPDGDFESIVRQAREIVAINGDNATEEEQIEWVPVQENLQIQVSHYRKRTSLHLDRVRLRWWEDSERERKVQMFRELGDATAHACRLLGDIDDISWGSGKELTSVVCPRPHWRQVSDAVKAIELGEYGLAERYIAEQGPPDVEVTLDPAIQHVVALLDRLEVPTDLSPAAVVEDWRGRYRIRDSKLASAIKFRKQRDELRGS